MNERVSLAQEILGGPRFCVTKRSWSNSRVVGCRVPTFIGAVTCEDIRYHQHSFVHR